MFNQKGQVQCKYKRSYRQYFLKGIVISIAVGVITLFSIILWKSHNAASLQTKITECEKLITHQVLFDFDENSHKEEREFIYEYYLKEYGKYLEEDIKARPEAADLFKLQLGIDTFDIDDDGDQDILAYFQEYGLCGSHGCLFIIFRNDGDNYTNMMSPYGGGITTYEDIVILKQKTNGVHDIAFNECPSLSIWKWDLRKKGYMNISEFN